MNIHSLQTPIIFWLALACMSLAIIIAITQILRKPPSSQAATDAPELQIYKKQLADVENDLAKQTIMPAEAEALKLEISRRLLAADRQIQTTTPQTNAPIKYAQRATIFSAIVIIGATFGLYTQIGATGAPDLSLKKRITLSDARVAASPNQVEAEAQLPPWSGPPENTPQDYLNLVDQLRQIMRERPDDERGLALLLQHENALKNYRAARQASDHLIALAGERASAIMLSRGAAQMITATKGYVSPQAKTLILRALAQQPNHMFSLYLMGLYHLQNDRPDLAFPTWRYLAENANQNESWFPEIHNEISVIAARAGESYTPPPLAPHIPELDQETREQVENMSDAERREMIGSMIERLADRLASDGGPPSEWAKLINALATFGDPERATAIYQEALSVFANDPDGTAIITAVAHQVGIAQ